MRLARFPYVLAALAAFALTGCDASTSRVDWPEPSPALWEVISANGDKAWLFGTVHALPDGVDWHTPALDSRLAEADVLIVEIANLGDSAAAQSAFEAAAFTPGLGEFQGRTSAEFDQGLQILLDGKPLNLPSDIEDWAAALQIASAANESDPANGVDRALLATNKPRLGLETYASQFAVFDTLSAADQKHLLDAVVFDENAFEPEMMARAWLTGNLATLTALSSTGILADSEVRGALLTRRNQRWLAQIAPIIDAGREPFIAVGAAHMLADDGLPALLKARGYSVERIQ